MPWLTRPQAHMRFEQEETITWKPYPEQKPTWYGEFLVTLTDPPGAYIVDARTWDPKDTTWNEKTWQYVTAWAVKPDPYHHENGSE